jgi:hypothetical protein
MNEKEFRIRMLREEHVHEENVDSMAEALERGMARFDPITDTLFFDILQKRADSICKVFRPMPMREWVFLSSSGGTKEERRAVIQRHLQSSSGHE